jgi:hypothetical protein
VQAFRLGATDYLLWPLREAEVINVVERVLKQVHERRDRERLSRQLLQANQDLQQRVEELTTLGSIGKAVTSITDQSLLFDRILEGASKVTRADLGWFLQKFLPGRSPKFTPNSGGTPEPALGRWDQFTGGDVRRITLNPRRLAQALQDQNIGKICPDHADQSTKRGYRAFNHDAPATGCVPRK